VGYRDVLRNREFASLYVSQSLSQLGDQLARIALALLVFERTGSALAASATFAAGYLAYLVGGPLLSGLSDRYPRLTVMVACDLLRAPAVLLLCLDSIPLWGVFALVLALGALGPPFDSARGALQPDLLEGEAYVVGNALLSITNQLTQVLGFVLGGTVVALTSVQSALTLDAATFLVSAGVLLLGVRHRPAAQPEMGANLLRHALEGFQLVLRTVELRTLLLLALLPSVAVTTTEGLAVPVAHELGGGAAVAGLLTAAAPAGFLLASVLVLRQSPARRTELMPALVLLSCLPLLLTPFLSSVGTLLALWVVAGMGATVNLVAGPAFMLRLPAEKRARGYGVAGSLLQAGQGLGLVLAGVLADVVGPRPAVAALALLCLVLAGPLLLPQGMRQTDR
jgi:MFS family permease